MVDHKNFLRQLHKNLNILEERKAKYANDAPLALLNQIEDHYTAIALTEQRLAEKLNETEWQAALQPLLLTEQSGNIIYKNAFELAMEKRGMSPSIGYGIIGIFVGAMFNIIINLIAAVIQQRLFAEQFSNQSIGWLVGLAIGFGLLGYWLGQKLEIPLLNSTPSQGQSNSSVDSQIVIISRLQAVLSYTKLRGKGVSLSDVLLIGSRLDIDTRE